MLRHLASDLFKPTGEYNHHVLVSQDKDSLTMCAERGKPFRTQDPPLVTISVSFVIIDLLSGGFLYPLRRYDLLILPFAVFEKQVADFCHIEWTHGQITVADCQPVTALPMSVGYSKR